MTFYLTNAEFLGLFALCLAFFTFFDTFIGRMYDVFSKGRITIGIDLRSDKIIRNISLFMYFNVYCLMILNIIFNVAKWFGQTQLVTILDWIILSILSLLSGTFYIMIILMIILRPKLQQSTTPQGERE